MELSANALTVLSQIIPLLLLASYFDRDALIEISRYTHRVRYYWFSVITIILLGELFAIFGVINGYVDGWRGYVIVAAAILALINLFSVAGWRVLGLDLVSGLPVKRKTKK